MRREGTAGRGCGQQNPKVRGLGRGYLPAPPKWLLAVGTASLLDTYLQAQVGAAFLQVGTVGHRHRMRTSTKGASLKLDQRRAKHAGRTCDTRGDETCDKAICTRRS